MTADPFVELKAKQREGWSGFAPIEVFTTPTATHLVRFAGVRQGQDVLDVGTGTGVVAITAARAGARVTGVDLTPTLLERARHNAEIAELEDVAWREADVEALPYEDASFDVVTSQFGHMFAPRAEVAIGEMLRVLRPGGTLAFATWPPEHFVGRLFALVGQLMPPAPPGASSPGSWGDPEVIRARLGGSVNDTVFERGVMSFVALSPQHYRATAETFGPFASFVRNARDPERVAAARKEVEALAALYFTDNAVRQDYLLTRATKAA